MATNAGKVVVTVSLDDSLRQRVIDLLTRAKHDHYSEPEGLNSCPATTGCHPGPRDNDRPCDCGADEINAEIDAMISELRKPPKTNGGIVYA